MRLLRHRSHAPSRARRGHAELRPAAIAAIPATLVPVAALAAERRLRASGGPEDTETHACRCGAVFGAAPTTSVSCPLCGVQQAW